jgi:hypothetical protein
VPVPILAAWHQNDEKKANIVIKALEASKLKVTDVLQRVSHLTAAPSSISLVSKD